MSADAEPRVYALLADGTTVEIRPARPEDFDAVREMHEKLSPDSLYLRFFSLNPRAAEREARRLCREPAPDHAALLAVMDGELIGCGSYECDDSPSRSAEIALAVADYLHHRGVGTLLLEHLVSLAHSRGLHAFTAETLSENALMLKVFADAGLQAHRALADGMYDLTFPLPAGEADMALGSYRDAVAERERSADVASLRHVLAPASVAVVGAGRRPGSVGRVILHNIVSGGFSGPVYAVNPAVAELDGVPCVPSAAALPGEVDLAIIATPAAAVTGIAEECGQRGVKGLVVLAAGLDGAARAELLGICRRHGMRMVGPASFGVADTSAGLDATFAARHPRAGSVGLALQSTGGAGFALAGHLSRIGVGISSLVSLGDIDDVDGTDMLLWWESDPATKLALLYLESIANPRKFARTARRVGRGVPVLTVIVGRSMTSRRVSGARATAATPLLTRQALFEQAGVIATANLGQLLDTAVLLASQPAPAGPRVAVVSNTRGAAVFAADACGDAGLQVARLAGDTQQALRDLLPRDATVAGPVDTTLLVGPGNLRSMPGAGRGGSGRRRGAGADGHERGRRPGSRGARRAAAGADRRRSAGPGGSGPAAPGAGPGLPRRSGLCLRRVRRPRPRPRRPLRHVAGGPAGNRARPRWPAPGSGAGSGRGISGRQAAGGWLPLDPTVELLACYGVPLADSTGVVTEDAAVAAAARLGGPVALRADVPGLVRARGAGALLIDLHGADEVRRGFRSLSEAFGHRLAGVIVKPMVTGGVEVMISMLHEEVVGPLVLFGAGGAAADALADRAARLAPLTDYDADELIRSIRAAPLLLGHPGAPGVDLTALRDLLLRVSQMADDLPQIAELELSPVFARPDGVQAVDARIRLQAAEPADAHLRRLP